MTEETEGLLWTMRDMQRADRAIGWVERHILGNPSSRRMPINIQETWYWAKISVGSTLTAGTLVSPTTFLFDVWLPDPASMATPIAYAVSADASLLGVTGVNRISASGAAGTTVKVEYGYGEWSLKGADC